MHTLVHTCVFLVPSFYTISYHSPFPWDRSVSISAQWWRPQTESSLLDGAGLDSCSSTPRDPGGEQWPITAGCHHLATPHPPALPLSCHHRQQWGAADVTRTSACALRVMWCSASQWPWLMRLNEWARGESKWRCVSSLHFWAGWRDEWDQQCLFAEDKSELLIIHLDSNINHICTEEPLCIWKCIICKWNYIMS